MTSVNFDGVEYALDDGETVLDALLRHGQDIPYGCRSGACQSCLLQTEPDTALPALAQAGLKTSQKKQGCFLSCCCKPQETISVTRARALTQKSDATVFDISRLSADVLQLTLNKPFACDAGQFINIWLDEHNIRSYSNAAPSAADYIQLHVKIIPGGRFSEWAATAMRTGDTLTIQGPLGDCVYEPATKETPLLLAATGTGLAPLLGVLHDAVQAGHTGQIDLYLAARADSGFYLQEELQHMAQIFEPLQVHFIAQEPGTTTGVVQGDIYQTIAKDLPALKNYRVYLCGAPTFVHKLKKQCFLSGAAMQAIHTDAFVAFA